MQSCVSLYPYPLSFPQLRWWHMASSPLDILQESGEVWWLWAYNLINDYIMYLPLDSTLSSQSIPLWCSAWECAKIQQIQRWPFVGNAVVSKSIEDRAFKCAATYFYLFSIIPAQQVLILRHQNFEKFVNRWSSRNVPQHIWWGYLVKSFRKKNIGINEKPLKTLVQYKALKSSCGFPRFELWKHVQCNASRECSDYMRLNCSYDRRDIEKISTRKTGRQSRHQSVLGGNRLLMPIVSPISFKSFGD